MTRYPIEARGYDILWPEPLTRSYLIASSGDIHFMFYTYRNNSWSSAERLSLWIITRQSLWSDSWREIHRVYTICWLRDRIIWYHTAHQELQTASATNTRFCAARHCSVALCVSSDGYQIHLHSGQWGSLQARDLCNHSQSNVLPIYPWNHTIKALLNRE